MPPSASLTCRNESSPASGSAHRRTNRASPGAGSEESPHCARPRRLAPRGAAARERGRRTQRLSRPARPRGEPGPAPAAGRPHRAAAGRTASRAVAGPRVRAPPRMLPPPLVAAPRKFIARPASGTRRGPRQQMRAPQLLELQPVLDATKESVRRRESGSVLATDVATGGSAASAASVDGPATTCPCVRARAAAAGPRTPRHEAHRAELDLALDLGGGQRVDHPAAHRLDVGDEILALARPATPSADPPPCKRGRSRHRPRPAGPSAAPGTPRSWPIARSRRGDSPGCAPAGRPGPPAGGSRRPGTAGPRGDSASRPGSAPPPAGGGAQRAGSPGSATKITSTSLT